jgi:hypothetical protein
MQKLLSFGRFDSYISMMQFSTLPFVQPLLRLHSKGKIRKIKRCCSFSCLNESATDINYCFANFIGR